MEIRILLIIYLVLISAVTFACFGIDKWKAANHRWRIKEATLILLCCMGGSIGGLLGMYLFRHKTRKPLFFAGVPAILIIQAVLSFMFYRMR